MDGSEPEEYEPNKIFVGGLSWNTTEENMRAYFSQFGAVTECVVMKDPFQPENLKRNRGFGFVKFEDPAAVDRVVNPQTTHTLDEKTIDPKRAQKKSQGVKDTDKKVFIGGLASTTTEEQVKDYFNTQYGGVSIYNTVQVLFHPLLCPTFPCRWSKLCSKWTAKRS
ncbi:RNA-binding protein Musashi homolog 1, partial [Geodia barretti]